MPNTQRRSLPKLKGHIGTRVEAKAERMGLTRKAVAKFLGCDPSYLNILYRGYSASHADAEGNPPAKPVPPSDKMAVKIREFLPKAADPALKELAAKYPPRRLTVAAPACPEPKAASKPKAAKKAPKRKTAKKTARKGKGQGAAKPKAAAQPAEQPDGE
jgi:hypothetical protein